MDVLLATDVAARGIDVKDIRLVINYSVPKNIEVIGNCRNTVLNFDLSVDVHPSNRKDRANGCGGGYSWNRLHSYHE